MAGAQKSLDACGQVCPEAWKGAKGLRFDRVDREGRRVSQVGLGAGTQIAD